MTQTIQVMRGGENQNLDPHSHTSSKAVKLYKDASQNT
jgi:hypothetical protein